MDDLKLIDVFAVYGDSVNIGRGKLIGVYQEEKHAKKAIVGRGSLDCASLPYERVSGERGNATIEKKKAIKINEEIYLLEIDHLVKLNIELIADRRVSTCIWEEPKIYFKVKVIYVSDPIEFMKFIREKTGMSFIEVKQVCDKARKTHNAIVEPMHNALDNQISKEEFQNWKQELGLRQIAEIEAC